MPLNQCICGEDLNYAGVCPLGMFSGGHQGNCIVCGENALLDGERCCSEECDQVAEDAEQVALEQEWGYFRETEGRP